MTNELKLGIRGTYKANCSVCNRPKSPNYCQCPNEPESGLAEIDEGGMFNFLCKCKSVFANLNHYTLQEQERIVKKDAKKLSKTFGTKCVNKEIVEELDKIISDIHEEINSRPQYPNIGKKGCISRLVKFKAFLSQYTPKPLVEIDKGELDCIVRASRLSYCSSSHLVRNSKTLKEAGDYQGSYIDDLVNAISKHFGTKPVDEEIDKLISPFVAGEQKKEIVEALSRYTPKSVELPSVDHIPNGVFKFLNDNGLSFYAEKLKAQGIEVKD